jgi:hypothetical protein
MVGDGETTLRATVWRKVVADFSSLFLEFCGSFFDPVVGDTKTTNR